LRFINADKIFFAFIRIHLRFVPIDRFTSLKLFHTQFDLRFDLFSGQEFGIFHAPMLNVAHRRDGPIVPVPRTRSAGRFHAPVVPLDRGKG